VHSHYQRRPSDLPWEGLPVRIQLNVRRFFCDGADCGQRIFTERLPKTVERYARRTCRLNAVLVEMALALGGTAASRLARQLGILASDSTFLRQLRRKGVAISARAPRVLGIDDWAWRKGHRYGTILCDLERGKVIDLLPDRSEESTERWLHEHPGAEIVSRDRASLYAEAATKAAPQAVQVADRWHLLHNLTESLSDVLVPYHRLLTRAAGVTAAKREVSAAQPGIVQPLSRSQSLQQQRREHRLSRYEAVMELLRQGVSQSEAARHCGLGRKTVRRWIRAGEFPERKPVARATVVDAYRAHNEEGQRERE
jgi:transposase